MYSTLEDYITEFGSDDIPSNDEDRVLKSLDRASRLINTYARSGGMSIPLEGEALESVRGHVLDIARYFAWSDSPTEVMRKRYEDAISFLERVATGKIRLVVNTGNKQSGFSNIRIVRC